ncbi:MAG: TonB family protein, partial [Rhodocyclaceae bacterium]|nr:TonB family protein [Rhodocyclaceae bacterium]
AIKQDGELERVEINRSSGHQVLDEAARRIVRLAAPYAVFPEAVRRDTDILEITRTWSFTGADQLRSE